MLACSNQPAVMQAWCLSFRQKFCYLWLRIIDHTSDPASIHTLNVEKGCKYKPSLIPHEYLHSKTEAACTVICTQHRDWKYIQ